MAISIKGEIIRTTKHLTPTLSEGEGGVLIQAKALRIDILGAFL
jgi:hypothetical protein